MATSSHIRLSSQICGVYHVEGVTEESAIKASELLQENHDRYHIFFNSRGFHDHIAHHLITAYALGASPSILQKHYDDNTSYQTPLGSTDLTMVETLHDAATFNKSLGKGSNYHQFLEFFRTEVERKGYEEVVSEYLFNGDERADDMLVRLFGSFYHPLIHLGLGLEFKQPAIVVEALAQAAVHDNSYAPFLKGAEAMVAKGNSTSKSKNLVELLDQCRTQESLRTAVTNGDKIFAGIIAMIGQSLDDVIQCASQWTVRPEELDEKAAEMLNAAVYYTGSAQHPPKQIKFDFFFIHVVNASIFFSTFLSQSWLTPANKVRLLEWKGRFDLALYVSQGCPRPLLSEITHYIPRGTSMRETTWSGIIDRVLRVKDDGHASKLIRALAHGERICKPYEKSEKFRIKGIMWEKLANMAVDSVEDVDSVELSDGRWVRSAGFAESWTEFDDRPKAHL